MCAIVVSYRSGEALRQCLRSLFQQSTKVEVVVVDNSPDDGNCRLVAAEWPQVRVVGAGANLGYAAGANLGAAATSSELLVFLNPDVILDPGCLAALQCALANGAGVAGPVLQVGATGRAEYGATLNHLGMPTALRAPGNLPLYVSGAILASPRRVFEAVGGFDDRYFMFVEDVEYCWRVLSTGLDVVCCGAARAWHRGGAVAAGGYPLERRPYETSGMRVSYRERNTIALFLSCAPVHWLPVVVPTLVGRSLALSAAAVVMRRPDVARGCLRGLVWNVVNLRQTLTRRRKLARSPAGDRAVLQRMSHEPVLLRTLARHWPPRIIGDHRP